ncbi:acetate/propionate family kinase [Undibacterium sp. Dicai25W]|uniref:acetate/propionate family kinase n=1 Tax=Undibacterium sp. Dicai25W TaxID=3413034 RepID=UPI003BF0A1FD
MNQHAILAVNAGSSSIKFALYPVHQALVDAADISGVVEGLEPGGKASISLSIRGEKQVFPLPGNATEEKQKFALALNSLRLLLEQHSQEMTVVAVAHRIVHGGDRYAQSVVIDANTMTYLQSLNSLAPLHQPHNLEGVFAFQKAYPDLPQIACFDTGFHANLPLNERTVALPLALRETGIRRYGFHGLSYRYVAGRLAQRSEKSQQRVIMAHLGNGASACAMLNGQSIATTMGFSALDGLMMGTRCGALDPGILLHLLQAGWDAKRIEKTLYKESGLLGVSGVSADMRTLRQSKDSQSQVAINMFVYRVTRESGALAACLNGVDVLAFTGGIGEHDAQLRADVVAGLAYLGLKIDLEKNLTAHGDQIAAIHASDSQQEIWVIPTDEGRIAAMDAAAILAAAGQAM